MRFLQVSAVLVFMALVGNILKPLYWNRLEDMIRRGSDFGGGPRAEGDPPEERDSGNGYVREEGFKRFRSEVREGFARASDYEWLKQRLQVNGEGDEELGLRLALEGARTDSLRRTLAEEYPSRTEVDSLLGEYVKQGRFDALQGVVQGLHRADRGGGLPPTPAGKAAFRRRDLWKGFHEIHPPYVMKAGGGR